MSFRKDRFLLENMIRAETKEQVCRIWRDPGKGELYDHEIKNRALVWMENTTIAFSIIKIAEIPGVNSVEIINRETGDGTCVHKNWP